MTDGIQISLFNKKEVLAGISKELSKYEAAALSGLAAVAFAISGQAKVNALTGQHARGQGHILGTGPGPNRVTGALIRSISTEVRTGFGTYKASVFPTMVYARAVEQGNPRWKSGVNYPYLEPAADTIRPKASSIFSKAVKRKLGK